MQLNNDTTGSQKTAQSGQAVFKVADGSANDIPVFPPAASSFINIAGTIFNFDPAKKYFFQLIVNNQVAWTNYLEITHGTYKFSAKTPMAEGPTISGEADILEPIFDPAAGQITLTRAEPLATQWCRSQTI